MPELEKEGQEPESTEVEPTEVEDESKPNEEEPSIQDLDVALKEIRKLRQENASKRVKNKKTEEELEEYRKWKEAQKSETERLRDAYAETQEELKLLRTEKLRRTVCTDMELDLEWAEFITGEDEESMKASAKKLVKKLQLQEASTPTSLGAGQRGDYVGGHTKRTAGGLFLEALGKDL